MTVTYKKRTLVKAGSRAAADSATTAAGTDLIPSTLVEDFATFSVQLTGTFAGSVQFQGSNDGVNWIALRNQALNSAAQASVTGAVTTTGIYRGTLGVRYFRAAVTAYTSGTFVATALFSPDAYPTTLLAS
jgi:hypothetical protein